jgi:hypothetical protein
MCSLYTKRAVVDPCCVGNRGASLGTPCNCICVGMLATVGFDVTYGVLPYSP